MNTAASRVYKREQNHSYFRYSKLQFLQLIRWEFWGGSQSLQIHFFYFPHYELRGRKQSVNSRETYCIWSFKVKFSKVYKTNHLVLTGY